MHNILCQGCNFASSATTIHLQHVCFHNSINVLNLNLYILQHLDLRLLRNSNNGVYEFNTHLFLNLSFSIPDCWVRLIHFFYILSYEINNDKSYLTRRQLCINIYIYIIILCTHSSVVSRYYIQVCNSR